MAYSRSRSRGRAGRSRRSYGSKSSKGRRRLSTYTVSRGGIRM